jgi:hypothetical protein
MKRTRHIFFGAFAFVTGTGTGVATFVITGALSFATCAFFAPGAFAIFATGAGAPMTAPAIFPPLRAQQQLPRGCQQLPQALVQKKSFLPSPLPPLRVQQLPPRARKNLPQARQGLPCTSGGE